MTQVTPIVHAMTLGLTDHLKDFFLLKKIILIIILPVILNCLHGKPEVFIFLIHQVGIGQESQILIMSAQF